MILVKCPVKPTEDKEKLRKKLEEFFSTEFKEKEGFLEARISQDEFKKACEDSNSFAFDELLQEKKIRISKMALIAGKVNLEDSHPLGSIEVILE